MEPERTFFSVDVLNRRPGPLIISLLKLAEVSGNTGSISAMFLRRVIATSYVPTIDSSLTLVAWDKCSITALASKP